MPKAPLHKLFWIGSPFFAPALAACDWQVHFFNFEEPAVYGWDDLVHMAGWEPDVVVVADKSRAPFVLGMENFPCLTVFYCVDSHIHSYYPLYAQAFDICLVSLKDHLPLFADKRLTPEQIWWFPAFAPDKTTSEQDSSPPTNFVWDCLFVGTVDAALNPARAAFLDELGELIPGLHCTRGDYLNLFPQGRVLLNHCVAGDLNFRIFEAMGCGGCLLSPAVGHGLRELFTENIHLLTYPPNNVQAAAAQLRTILDSPVRQENMRRAALNCIDAGHRACHRAQEFTRKIQTWYNEKGLQRSQERRRQAQNIRNQWLRMPYLLFADNLSHPALQRAYLRAAQGIFESKTET